MSQFYDKVAKRYGGYAFGENKPKYTKTFSNGDPEEVFKAKILEVANTELKALDVGCGDGRFTFDVAKSFGELVGLDFSKGLLEVANKKKQEINNENVTFVFGDAKNMPFEDESFDGYLIVADPASTKSTLDC